MARTKAKTDSDTAQEQSEEVVLVTLSKPDPRFNVEDNMAEVKPSQLKENEQFVVVNGKTHIHVTTDSNSYFL